MEGREDGRKKRKEKDAEGPSMSVWWQASREGDEPSRSAWDCSGFRTESHASWEIPQSCVNWDGGSPTSR